MTIDGSIITIFLVLFIVLTVLPAYAFAFVMYKDKTRLYEMVDKLVNPPTNLIPLSSIQGMFKPRPPGPTDTPPPGEPVKPDANFTYL